MAACTLLLRYLPLWLLAGVSYNLSLKRAKGSFATWIPASPPDTTTMSHPSPPRRHAKNHVPIFALLHSTTLVSTETSPVPPWTQFWTNVYWTFVGQFPATAIQRLLDCPTFVGQRVSSHGEGLWGTGQRWRGWAESGGAWCFREAEQTRYVIRKMGTEIFVQ